MGKLEGQLDDMEQRLHTHISEVRRDFVALQQQNSSFMDYMEKRFTAYEVKQDHMLEVLASIANHCQVHTHMEKYETQGILCAGCQVDMGAPTILPTHTPVKDTAMEVMVSEPLDAESPELATTGEDGENSLLVHTTVHTSELAELEITRSLFEDSHTAHDCSDVVESHFEASTTEMEMVDLTTDSDKGDGKFGAPADQSIAQIVEKSDGASLELELEECAAVPTDSRYSESEPETVLELPALLSQPSLTPRLWSDDASDDDGAKTGGGDSTPTKKCDPAEQQDTPPECSVAPRLLKLSSEMQVKALCEKIQVGLQLFNPGVASNYQFAAKFGQHISSLPVQEAEAFIDTVYDVAMDMTDADMASMLAQESFRAFFKID